MPATLTVLNPRSTEYERVWVWMLNLPWHATADGSPELSRAMSVREISRATGVPQVALPPILDRMGWHAEERLPGGIWLWRSPVQLMSDEERHEYG